ncbi:MAG: UbiA prenyltransferase family protein [Minicystis sp.]
MYAAAPAHLGLALPFFPWPPVPSSPEPPRPSDDVGELTSTPPATGGAVTTSERPRSSEPASKRHSTIPPSGKGELRESQITQTVPVIPESPEGTLLWRVRGMIRSLRPQQWVKNLFVLAPIVFAKELTRPALLVSAAGAFAIFCLLAGAVYTLNDLVDAPADRVHPVKRFRPIASGRVPVPVAKAMVAGLVVISIGAALAFFPLAFALVALAYFAQNVAYSFKLKKIAYVDVGFIAFGFVLRVLAGGFATRTYVSFYLIACTALLALFLGFGKRRHELAGTNAKKQRSALEAYTPRALTIALAVTGLLTLGAYLAYTLDSATQIYFGTKWLWVTTIHPVFGVIRFLQLVAGRPKAESPTQEMLRDVPFVLNLVLFVIEALFFVYNVKFS